MVKNMTLILKYQVIYKKLKQKKNKKKKFYLKIHMLMDNGQR